jgi:hypothetical protein
VLCRGIALGKALVIGKFVLIGEALNVGSRMYAPSLLHRIAWKSLALLLGAREEASGPAGAP